MEASEPSANESLASPGIPEQKTLALVNTYVIHTTRLLNDFALAAEHRLQILRNRLQDLDIKLQLLEAKVDSAYKFSAERTLEDSERNDDSLGGEASSQDRANRPSKIEAPESTSASQQGDLENDIVDDFEELASLQGRGGPESPQGFSFS